jgi:protein SCO1/2
MATDPTTEPARSPLRTVRLLIWGLVALAVVGFAFLLLRPAPAGPGETVLTRAAPGMPGFTLGGPFTLTGSDGKPFNSAQALAGKPYAVFFGFTNCPDVCPNTLGRLARYRQKLGQGEGAFEIVFVSVDPERDTPAAVGKYATLFGTPIIGLTGTPEQVAKVAKQHAIYQAKVKDAAAPDGYTMDHGAAVLLFGRDGKFVGTIAQEEGAAPALDKLKRITA